MKRKYEKPIAIIDNDSMIEGVFADNVNGVLIETSTNTYVQSFCLNTMFTWVKSPKFSDGLEEE